MEDLVGPYLHLKKYFSEEAAFLGQLDNLEAPLSSPLVCDTSELKGYIVPFTWADTKNAHLIEFLKDLRNKNQFAYPTRFLATTESTQKWLVSLLSSGHRILFKICDPHMRVIGHIGLAWNAGESRLELDSVQRGSSEMPGIMGLAVRWLENYCEKEFNSSCLYLRVLQSNGHAVRFYSSLGYKVISSEAITISEGGNPEKSIADLFLTMMKDLEAARLPKAEILTAGPSIGYRERLYTFDAVTNGWNSHHATYIRKLQDSFSTFVGSNHALATSSCTGALHLAFAALGVGPGDEVIVPAITWVATASAVSYTGARPIFADVDPKTWTLDPNSVKSKLTSSTKAIVAVHLYGFLSDVGELRRIADERGIFLVEDAAPAIGATLNGRMAGTFGHIGCFSFQGAKLLVSGEGGILVTDSSEIYERAVKLQEHGRRAGTFWIEELGYKYKMSNLTAALAVGQLERALPQIEKKRTISSWYRETLSSLKGLGFQNEIVDSEAIHWMTSILLTAEKIGRREDLMSYLKSRGIDTRPVFPNISKFSFWGTDSDHLPVADAIADNGINLPSGVGLTKADVSFVSKSIRDFFHE